MSHRFDFREGLALVAAPDGELFLAEGPFVAFAKPDQNGFWIYSNDFDLRRPLPWLRAARARVLRSAERADLLSQLRGEAPPPPPRWRAPERAGFERDFAALQAAIAPGRLFKGVPIVVERGEIAPGAEASWRRRLLATLLDETPAGLYPYFFSADRETIAGLSPELLFERAAGKQSFHTHALAGTQARGERPAEEFLKNPKLTHEQEFVVSGLTTDLKKAGARVTVGPRRVKSLPSLDHIETPLDFELDQSQGPQALDNLLRALHPSPALGAYPKGPAADEFLNNLHAAGERGGYGAPFGFFDAASGICRFIVAIRNVRLRDTEIMLMAGAGVTAESRIDEEWFEIGLKRASVKKLLRL